jgi:methyltransferase (TIGR00027 family)
MDDERPSLTPEGAAVMRALHQQLDGDPKILDDPVAARLVDHSSDFYQSRLELLARLPVPTRQRLKSTFVMRSRFAEDCLAESLGSGVRQYVLLGAGLDTFAFRQPSWADTLRVFEVDHPATQRWKRGLLKQAGLSLPANLSFVPTDFKEVSLATALSQARMDNSGPTFLSMLGVSQYLTDTTLDETLKFVLSLPRHSELVFSFVASDAVLTADDVALAKAFSDQFLAIGEPWLSRFVPDQLVAKLTMMGFSKVFHLAPEKANQLYFQNRSDGLNASLLEQMIRATV